MSDLIDGLSDGLQNAGETILSFVPRLIGALAILVVGWLVARLILRVVKRLLKAVGLDGLLERAGLGERLQAVGYTATDLVARAIYWIALLVVFLLTAEALDVEYLSNILTGLIGYLPLVVVAMIIVIVAAAVGAFLAEVSTPWSQERHIRWLPETARWMVIGFGVFAALNTLKIAEEIVNTLFIAVVATAGAILVIAFGLGASPRRRNGGPASYPTATDQRSRLGLTDRPRFLLGRPVRPPRKVTPRGFFVTFPPVCASPY